MSMNIKIKLDSSSIDKAISDIQKYREDIQDKLDRFVRKLSEDGVTVAQARLGATTGDSTDYGITYTVASNGDIVTANISLVGGDALFVEFGAGIALNTGNTHPKASEFGYGIGTYPSKHPPNKAMNPGYWFYRENGTLVRSIGTEASMPIYHAGETIRNNAIMRAMEIFRS